jgi:hypothetical protein
MYRECSELLSERIVRLRFIRTERTHPLPPPSAPYPTPVRRELKPRRTYRPPTPSCSIAIGSLSLLLSLLLSLSLSLEASFPKPSSWLAFDASKDSAAIPPLLALSRAPFHGPPPAPPLRRRSSSPSRSRFLGFRAF